jgi:GT2 family glycosyltransferase
MLFLDRLFPRTKLFSARELAYWDHADGRDVECLSGACMMLSRALDRRLCGFDERLFMYGEDLDLCCRIRAEGLLLHYLASEVIYHHEGAASKKKGRSFAPLFQRAANYYFLDKNFGPARALGYRGAVSLGSVIRIVAGVLLFPAWILRRDSGSREFLNFLLKHTDLFLWSIGAKGLPTR